MTFTALQQDYLGGGLAAARPSAATLGPSIPPGSCAFYFATDTNVLSRLAGGDVAWQLAAGGGGGGGGGYTAIGSPIVSAGSAASVQFNTIPNTYAHLKVIMRAASNENNGGNTEQCIVQFNGDAAGGNYSATGQGLYGAVAGFPSAGGLLIPSGATAGVSFGQQEMNIFGYADAAVKYWTANSSGIQAGVGVITATGGGTWASGAAITGILLKPTGGQTWKDGSKFWLYGLA